VSRVITCRSSVAPSVRFTTAPVVDDQRERDRQAIDHRPGEVKAAAGDERDLQARRRRLDQRVAMAVGKPPAAVQQRPVDVYRQQADH